MALIHSFDAAHQRMKVLHIISGDLWAGAEAQALALLTSLKQSPNIHISVVLLNDGELANRLRLQGIPIIILSEQKENALQIFFGIWIQILRVKPDVIHTHRTKENILGSFANLLSLRRPCVRTVHGAAETTVRGILHLGKQSISTLDYFCARYLQKKVIAVSVSLCHALESRFPQGHVVAIENGIDPIATREMIHPVEFRNSAPTHIHIGLVGRLVPVKRVDIFVEMAQTLLKNSPSINWQFHIFGDGPLRVFLTEYAKQLDPEGRIHMHGHREDIVACIASLDALVICSDHEGLPMTALESIAVGTPIIAHSVGGLTTLLSENRTGRLVSRQDPDEYAQAVLEQIGAPPQERQPEFCELYSAKHNAERVKELYESLMP